MLGNTSYSLAQISELMGFSSPAISPSASARRRA